MPRRSYSEYLKYAMQKCIRNADKIDEYGEEAFVRQADKLNYTAILFALDTLDEEEERAVKAVYGSTGPFNEAVEEAAASTGVKVPKIWKAIDKFEKVYAVRRGLV